MRNSDENIIVVIDPGHGGEALGGNIEDRIERDINLITANAMKERLEEYEGITVYLTRDNNTDIELTRKQRLEFAQKVDADFLFSIHYNMSAEHTLFGSEVWICSYGDNYSQGKSFATIETDALSELGLFDRGIKTRLSKSGDEYYGILKYSQAYNIPAVIIEHCHLDEERDGSYWNEDSYINFGITDADCVAKYYHLSSTTLGIDYSTYEYPIFDIPSSICGPDETPPEFCNINLLNVDNTNMTAEVEINAKDTDNYVQYYMYSLDNGYTYSRLEPWENRDSDTCIVELPLNPTKDLNVIFMVSNQYDLVTESNTLHIAHPPIPTTIVKEPETDEQTPVTTIEIDVAKKDNKINFFGLLLTFILLFLGILITCSCILHTKRKKKKRKKSNENR